MNTRRYPRTMNEAFPYGPEYGCAITRYKHAGATFKDYAAAIIIGVALAALLFFGLSS